MNEKKSNLQNPIRVLITDDHALVRSGLRYFILAFDDLELVGEASSGEQALELCAQVQPDVVLMDLMMTGMDGVTATRTIRERWPHIHVIALTNFQEAEWVHAVKFHVSNVLSKLDVTSRAEATAMALQHHLVPRPGET